MTHQEEILEFWAKHAVPSGSRGPVRERDLEFLRRYIADPTPETVAALADEYGLRPTTIWGRIWWAHLVMMSVVERSILCPQCHGSGRAAPAAMISMVGG